MYRRNEEKVRAKKLRSLSVEELQKKLKILEHGQTHHCKKTDKKTGEEIEWDVQGKGHYNSKYYQHVKGTLEQKLLKRRAANDLAK